MSEIQAHKKCEAWHFSQDAYLREADEFEKAAGTIYNEDEQVLLALKIALSISEHATVKARHWQMIGAAKDVMQKRIANK